MRRVANRHPKYGIVQTTTPDAFIPLVYPDPFIHPLLTWNCSHFANAELRPRIETVCRDRGYEPPVICTPEELLRE